MNIIPRSDTVAPWAEHNKEKSATDQLRVGQPPV